MPGTQLRASIARRYSQRASAALALAALLLSGVATGSAEAQSLSLLYSFTNGADGGYPYGGLVRDTAGNLYGTTYYGGGYTYGTAYELDTAGTETVLHSFGNGQGDGASPDAGLVRDKAGNLYGTTYSGGAGYGIVFMVDTTGAETILHSFAGGTDGETPLYGALVRDGAGNLYGTTKLGGAFGAGSVFKVTKTGKETVLYSFTNGTDGGYPYAGLIRDSAGSLYGTTDLGGAFSNGTVFKVTKTGQESVLYSFAGGMDGQYPVGGLVVDKMGNFYGTTKEGGTSNDGTVFMLTASGKETVLHSFAGGTDGANPLAGVVRDTKGNLYGTTEGGGTSGVGTVFKVTANGTETVLHTFTGSPGDGANPYGGLIRDTKGNLYGSTFLGGAFGHGAVYKVTP